MATSDSQFSYHRRTAASEGGSGGGVVGYKTDRILEMTPLAAGDRQPQPAQGKKARTMEEAVPPQTPAEAAAAPVDEAVVRRRLVEEMQRSELLKMVRSFGPTSAERRMRLALVSGAAFVGVVVLLVFWAFGLVRMLPTTATSYAIIFQVLPALLFPLTLLLSCFDGRGFIIFMLAFAAVCLAFALYGLVMTLVGLFLDPTLTTLLLAGQAGAALLQTGLLVLLAIYVDQISALFRDATLSPPSATAAAYARY